MGLLLVAGDTTSLSYWLNLKFLLCAIWVFTSIIIASFLIWKYEGTGRTKTYKEVTRQEKAWSLYDCEAWMPCIKGMHPAWLLLFRIVAFCVLFTASTADVVYHGTELYFYYTQWTFMLVTFYFAFGSILSGYGCFRQHKACNIISIDVDVEQDIYLPLAQEAAGDTMSSHFLKTCSFWGYIFQIIFQVTAGATMLTDSVYWFVIVPFLSIVGYEMSFLTVVAHSLNLVMLLGDTALNSLRFPWFRISYFIFLTAFYVIFEWVVHACVSTWWPYPFLDLDTEYAPLWYLVVALLHLPCYAMYALIVELKYYVLSRWFPQSYQCLR